MTFPIRSASVVNSEIRNVKIDEVLENIRRLNLSRMFQVYLIQYSRPC